MKTRAKVTWNSVEATRPEGAGGNPMKRDNSVQCSVCARWFTTGGRLGRRGPSKGLPPLCPAHYHRALRGSPRAKDPGHGHGKRETKADRLARVIDSAQRVVDVLERLRALDDRHGTNHVISLSSPCFIELNAALIAWNVGAR